MSARVDSLLRPVAGEAPCGVDLRSTPLYAEIVEARRNDDPSLPRGIWDAPLRIADWPKVAALCSDALAQTKDLRLACWLAEAWTRCDGFAGAADGFALIGGLCTRYWGQLQPPDEAYQLAAIEWLLRHLPPTLRLVPIVPALPPRDKPFSWADLILAEQLEQVRQRDPAAANRAEANNAPTRAAFAAALAQSETLTLETQRRGIDAALAALQAMDADFAEAGIVDVPAVEPIAAVLRPASRFFAAELAARPQATPPAPLPAPAPAPSSPEPQPLVSTSAAAGFTRLPDRAAAYRQIAEAAAYLAEVEPHSPVPYVLALVARWERMSLSEIDAALHADGGDMMLLLEAIGATTRCD